MLAVHQPKIFSRDLVVYDGDSAVAEIVYQSFSTETRILVGGREYVASRTGWFSGSYHLKDGDSVVVTAEPFGFWRRRFEILSGLTRCELQRTRAWLAMGWTLTDGEREIGSVRRRGFCRTETIAEFPPGMDPVLQAFIIWLANVLWQQDQAAAAT